MQSPLALFLLHLFALGLVLAGQRDVAQAWAPWGWAAAAILGLLLWWWTGDGALREEAATDDAALAEVPQARAGRARRALLILGLLALAVGLRQLYADLASGSGALLWLSGLLAVAVALATPRARPRRRLRRREAAAASLLVAAALALRLYDLSSLPADVNNDEGEHGDSGLNIVHGLPLHPGNPAVVPSPFQTGWQTEPTGGHWLLGALMQIAGEDVFGLRLTAALSGAAGVGLLHLFLRDWVRPSAAIAAAWLLALGHVQLFWSRTGFLQATVAALSTAVIWLVLRGLRWGGAAAFVAAGLLLGLAQYVYWSARVLLPVLALFGVYLLLVHRPLLRRRLAGVGLMAALFLLSIAPLALWSARNPNTLLARGRGVFVLGNRPLLQARYPGLSGAEVVLAQLGQSLAGFARDGDGSRAFYRGGAPLLDPVAAALTLLGLLGFALHWRRPERVLVGLWLWPSLLALCGLTLDPPPTQRLMFLFPALYFVAGVVLDRITALALAAGRAPATLWRALLLLLLAWAAVWNYRVFFVRYRGDWPAKTWTSIAYRMRAAGPSHKTYVVAPPDLDADNAAIRFLARGLVATDLAADDLPLRERTDQHALFIVSPAHDAALSRLRELYPGGQEEELRDVHGKRLVAAYRVDVAEIAAHAGPAAARRTVAQRIGMLGSATGRLRGPRGVAVGLDGRIYVADTGNQRVGVFAPDGTPLPPITGEGTPAGRLAAPWSLAIAPGGDLLVLERPGRRLRRFDRHGEWREDTALGAVGDPTALAVTADGTLIVTDGARHSLYVLPPAGPARTVGGRGRAAGRFDLPLAVAVATDGSVYVSENGNRRVQRLAADFRPIEQWPLPPLRNLPAALAADPRGGVWVAHSGHAAVHLYRPGGVEIAAVGREGSQPDDLLNVGGIAVAPEGDVLVLDATRQQVWRYRP